jgi:hypothetical protein
MIRESHMIRSVALFALFFSFAVTASAHHGFGTFEVAKTITLTGKLTRVEFINPHSWLYFDVTDASGKVTRHRCEMRSSHTLRRSGWTKELFPIGEQVTIEAAPDRADAASCYLKTIRFANGSHMDRYGQYVKAGQGRLQEVRGPVGGGNRPARAARRASGEPNLTGDWAPEQVVMADPRGSGGALVPLSTIATAKPGEPGTVGRRGGGAGTGPRLYGGTELTPAGEQAAAKFTQQDNPRFRCETTSIIFDWTFDGPVNRITQNRDDIVIQYGQMDLKRTIHMSMKTHPASLRPSRAGHSIGRWEGDVLVVDTVGFLPGVLNAPVRHSDKLHVVERFSLDPKTMKLTRSYVAEDPINLKGQYTGQDVVEPADQPYTSDDCKEQGFIDYSKQAQRR